MRQSVRFVFGAFAAVVVAVVSATGQGQRANAGKVFKLEEATVADIHAAFEARALTCQQLAKLYLNRIAAYEDGGPKLNTITTVNPRLLEDAAALDRAWTTAGKRPLHCIPVLLKDNINTHDMPTSNGSVILKDSVPPDDAYITKGLRDNGALILGKGAMGEFAGGGYNAIDGAAKNPYNFKRGTSGSSSGPAAALAANLTVLAVGSDTSTSVRGPASWNGVVGLRPTTGLISRGGIAPKNLLFDTAGPMARTVTDMAVLLTAIAGPDPRDPLSVDIHGHRPAALAAQLRDSRGYAQFLKKGALKGARLGVARDLFGGDPEVDALANAAVARMKELGASVVDVTFDSDFVEFYLRGAEPNIRRIADYRFKADWEAYLATLGPKIPKTVAQFVEIYETQVAKSPLPVEASIMDLLKHSLTTSADDPAYKDLVERVLPAATARKLAIFDANHIDALVCPFQGSFATPLNTPAGRVEDPTYVAPSSRNRLSAGQLAGYSSVGFPSLVVPMGFGSQGLPSDITLMGRPYDEGKLIGYAYDYEQATRLRRPSSLVPPLQGETVAYPPIKPAGSKSR